MEKKKIKKLSAIAAIIALTGTVYSASAWASDNGDQPKQEQAAQGVAQEGTQPAGNEAFARHDKLTGVAKEFGIDITGMTDEQIEAALDAEKLKRGPDQASPEAHASIQDMAKKLGIDTTGMTDSQVKQAITDNRAKDAEQSNGRSIDKNAMTPEQLHQALVEVAQELNIDITGKNDDQIEEALRAYKMAHSGE
ncbi:hypothetical protein [Cohnella yongneupensis]|uniref:Uncharacterized protein n=1 Tax=Cohnella yongneupensis TaxID=425006 RepID=A0ABW0QUQ6_9BACL